MRRVKSRRSVRIATAGQRRWLCESMAADLVIGSVIGLESLERLDTPNEPMAMSSAADSNMPKPMRWEMSGACLAALSLPGCSKA